MKRRILNMITALTLCLSFCSTWAFAAEGELDEANVPAPIDEPAEGTVVQVEKDGNISDYNTIEAAWTAAM